MWFLSLFIDVLFDINNDSSKPYSQIFEVVNPYQSLEHNIYSSYYYDIVA